ncbi:thymidylate synthase [Vibrio phage vB_VhaM_VH-8]|nr:thymidylate synthase [Vibrio phage vB_VhaM_VH-8]
MKLSNMQVEYVDHLGSDINVINAARVSFSKESKEFDEIKDTKLINYLAKHNHFTPLAHTAITLRFKAPIFMARQFVKHQVGMVWNEESRRYINDEPEFYIPKEYRGRPDNIKQGSEGVLENSLNIESQIIQQTQEALNCYNQLLEDGVAPEMARMVLPQNTMTNWMWTGSLVAFSRVYKLRVDSHAQKEAQDIAKMIDEVVSPLYPVSWKALLNN